MTLLLKMSLIPLVLTGLVVLILFMVLGIILMIREVRYQMNNRNY